MYPRQSIHLSFTFHFRFAALVAERPAVLLDEQASQVPEQRSVIALTARCASYRCVETLRSRNVNMNRPCLLSPVRPNSHCQHQSPMTAFFKHSNITRLHLPSS